MVLIGDGFGVTTKATALGGGGHGFQKSHCLSPSVRNMQGTDDATTMALTGGGIDPFLLRFLPSQDCLYVRC